MGEERKEQLVDKITGDEFRFRLFKKCVREHVTKEQYDDIIQLYRQKLEEAKEEGLKKSTLKRIFP